MAARSPANAFSVLQPLKIVPIGFSPSCGVMFDRMLLYSMVAMMGRIAAS